MSNTLLTINMITREALRLFINSNNFLKNVDKQYDDSFGQAGAKIGSSLRIRKPVDYTVRTGPAASVQDTAEQSVTLPLATQKGVDVSFSSADLALSLDDFSRRILKPMVNNLAGAVAADLMSGANGGVANFVSKLNAGAVDTPDASTWLSAGAALDRNSAPRGMRKIVMDPLTQARTVSTLQGLFNPQPTISKQFTSGEMYQALGFDWMMDQTTIIHTTGAYGALGTVSGGGQSGSSITTTALAGPLNKGDIITFQDVYQVNRVTKQSSGNLMQFVVTANVAANATSIPIYPALTPPSGGNPVQYQTVDSSPVGGATISVVTQASERYRANIAFVPEAITLATAPLELPRGVHDAARETYDGVSMRMVSQYQVSTDQFITRLDLLYGYLWVRPEWAVFVADKI